MATVHTCRSKNHCQHPRENTQEGREVKFPEPKSPTRLYQKRLLATVMSLHDRQLSKADSFT